jgi:hypothetical protein
MTAADAYFAWLKDRDNPELQQAFLIAVHNLEAASAAVKRGVTKQVFA